jgi:spore germination protein KC
MEWWERNLKRWLLFALICTVSILNGGCWDRIEINDMAFVMATGIDALPNKKIKVSIQLALPTGGGQSPSQPASNQEKSFIVETSSGVDIWGTSSKIQEKLSRKVFTAHRRILIIGEQLAKQGIGPILDAFVRHPDSRLRTYVLVAKGSTAEKLLNVDYPLEKEPIEGLREIFHSKVGLTVNLRDVLKEMPANKSIVLPAVELVNNGEEGKKIFRLNGAAVFYHDKLAGYLNDQKTRELVWLRREQQQAELTVSIPKIRGNISANVINTSVSMKARKINGQLVMYINALTKLEINENQTSIDLSEMNNIKMIERMFAGSLKKQLNSALNEVQHKYKSDVAGFGQVIHRTYPRDWKKMKQNWDQEFPNMKFVVQTEVKIRNTGMTSQPINLPKEQIKKSIP